MGINVIIFGATGMVGEGVVHCSIVDPAVDSILIVGRRTSNVVHPKVSELVHGNFFDYSSIESELTGYDSCFFCLGVTSIGKSEEEYRRLTYDLTMAAAATLSRVNRDMVFCYVSGAGTDSSEGGKSMWARIKGKTENDLMRLPFKSVYAFRPGYIKPIPGLKNAQWFAKALSPLYPILKLFFRKYVCTLEDLGRAMIRASSFGYRKRILECEDITLLSGTSGNVDLFPPPGDML
jgi:hypothetical protein